MIRKKAILPAISMALALTGCGMNKTDDNDRAVRVTEPDQPAETVRATEPKRYNHGNYDPENNDETSGLGDAVNDAMDDAGGAVNDVMDDAGDIVDDVADGAGDIVSDVADGAGDIVSDAADAGRDMKDDAERHD